MTFSFIILKQLRFFVHLNRYSKLLCTWTFQAHKSIRPNARRFPGVVESRSWNRGRYGRWLRNDARIKYREKIVYHIRATRACLTASYCRKKEKRNPLL